LGASTHLINYRCTLLHKFFLDDSTKFLWLFPLKLKSDVLQIFQKFQAAVERQFNTKIKAIQTDWGGEYRILNHFLQTQGITHRVTCPYTHQQAGAIERRHRQIVEVGLALLFFLIRENPTPRKATLWAQVSE